MNEKKIPAIRFQEFTDDWEQRKLGDKMYIKSRIGWQRLTKDEYLSSGEYYLITGTDIDEYTHTIDLKHSYYVSKDRYDKDRNIQVHNGDIIVTKDGTIGKVAMVCNLDKPATLNSHLFVLRDMSGKIYNRFLLQFLTSDLFTRFVDATKTGSTLTGMPQKIFVKFQYMIPSFSEQKKVADMLDGIDNIIAIHQRKLNKLQLLKKSMLTKMFPKDGARVPEIRFQGFHGNWEHRKISEMFKITRGYVLPTKYTIDIQDDINKYPVFSSQTANNGLMGYYKDYLYENAITWTTDGANAGTVRYRRGKFYCTNVCGVLLSDNITASKMIAEALNQVAKKYVSYVGNPKLMNNVMADIVISLPQDKEEQDVISKYFEMVDYLILLQQRKLSKLHQIKQAMLSKLFV